MCQFGFHLHSVLGNTGSCFIVVAGQLSNFVQISYIRLAYLLRLGILLEIVVAIVKSQAGLGDMEDVHLAILGVGINVRSEECASTHIILSSGILHHSSSVRNGFDLLKIFLQRSCSVFIPFDAIHSLTIERSYTILISADFMLSCCKVVHNQVYTLEGAVVQDVE